MKKIIIVSLMFAFTASVAFAQCPDCRINNNAATWNFNNYDKSLPVYSKPAVINGNIRAASIDVKSSNSAEVRGILEFDNGFYRSHSMLEVRAYTNRNSAFRTWRATDQNPLK